MRWCKKNRLLLRITQTTAVVESPEGTHIWGLCWELYDASMNLLQYRLVNLVEPFTPDEYEDVATYLDESLDDVDFDQELADGISNTIDDYRHSLFQELELSRCLDFVQGCCLEIHIWPKKKQGQARRSIHSIQWEQLENLKLWSHESQIGICSVTVCRHVHYKGKRVLQSLSDNAWKQDVTGHFNVLLVVARSDVHKAPNEVKKVDVLNPATVRSVLLQLQEELVTIGSSQRIRLEIVRPGCFDELRKHLSRRRHMGMEPYHVVHFDLHGGISKDERAFLRFNTYTDVSNELKNDDVFADRIAKLLRDHEVNCVVLNACQSAVAHRGTAANLSSIFVKNGISAVLAMSHKMHDSISKRFYSKFYHRLFVHHDTTYTAASIARKKLFNDRKRWSYAQREIFKMQDWFIPVVYTINEEPFRFSRRRSWFLAELFGNLPATEILFSALVSIAIYRLLFESINLKSEEEIVTQNPNQSTLVAIVKMWTLVFTPLATTLTRIFGRLRWYWNIRQQLQILAEDRQNVLRIEGDLRKRNIVFFYSTEHVEEQARPFIDSLAAIWKCTHFLAHRHYIDAEWFVQPIDLTFKDSWDIWKKACINMICFWVYRVPKRNFSSTREANSVTFIENLDVLYPEAEDLRETQYYAPAQRRLEDWLVKNFSPSSSRVSPYLMFTALRGRALGDRESVSKWLRDGPGRCGVLGSTAMTVYVETSQQYVDPTNAKFDKQKWYDSSLRWICGDVSRPRRKGLLSALCDLPGRLVDDFL